MRLGWRRWLDNVAVLAAEVLMVLGILLGLWLWAGATMVEGPARDYQCSVGNQNPWACEEDPA